MQVIIGSTDITEYIQEKTYDINAQRSYTSWTDSNFREHRDNIYEKISGSFQMVFFDGYSVNGVTVDKFADLLDLVEANTTDGVTTLRLTVNNLNAELKTISCYVDIQANPMLYAKNGSNVVVKRVTFNVQEQ